MPTVSAWWGFPRGTSGKEPARQCRRHKRCGFDPWVGKIPWWRAWQRTPVFLPWESHGQRILVGYGPQGCTESDTTKWLNTHAHNTWYQLIHLTLIASLAAFFWFHPNSCTGIFDLKMKKQKPNTSQLVGLNWDSNPSSQTPRLSSCPRQVVVAWSAHF